MELWYTIYQLYQNTPHSYGVHVMDDLEYLTPLTSFSRQTLAEATVERLRSAICSGRLKPGARLVEREVAARLNVSHIPVREAIHQLVEEGLATKIPRHGTFVHVPSRVEVEEIASLPIVLEQFAVERVMARWDPKCGTRLRWIIDDMEDATANRDCAQLFEADKEFHLTLWQMADHRLLVEIASSLHGRISRFLYQAVSAHKDTPLFDQYVNRHIKLVEALQSGDLARAREQSVDHIEAGLNRVLSLHELSTASDDAHDFRRD